MVNPRYHIDGDPHCMCSRCCGNRKKVTITKDLLGYDKNCMQFCRVGEQPQQHMSFVFQRKQKHFTSSIVAEKCFDVKCTNSKIWADIDAEFTLDLHCSGAKIIRDIECVDTTFVNRWLADTTGRLCQRGEAEVEVDLTATIAIDFGIQPKTILADCVRVQAPMHSGGICFGVSPVPTVGNAVQVDVDINFSMCPP